MEEKTGSHIDCSIEAPSITNDIGSDITDLGEKGSAIFRDTTVAMAVILLQCPLQLVLQCHLICL